MATSVPRTAASMRRMRSATSLKVGRRHGSVDQHCSMSTFNSAGMSSGILGFCPENTVYRTCSRTGEAHQSAQFKCLVCQTTLDIVRQGNQNCPRSSVTQRAPHLYFRRVFAPSTSAIKVVIRHLSVRNGSCHTLNCRHQHDLCRYQQGS